MENFNIDNLTLGQIKEIQKITAGGADAAKPQSNIAASMKGKYVIVRSRNEGINAGFVVDAYDTGIILSSARRIWYHKPKDQSVSWYEGVATTGLSNDSKVSCVVDEKVIVEDYSVTLCSELAKTSIMEIKAHEQS